MTAILVHGVPDTYRVWDGVRKHLGRSDVKALALPGFGVPLPAGFQASKEAYVDWITGELEKEDGPVDLVGHDWGCILVARVASLRPDLVRTWAGGDGPVSAAYVWHPWARSGRPRLRVKSGWLSWTRLRSQRCWSLKMCQCTSLRKPRREWTPL
jgi:pimeloyl-ACP methyl ester carboxylesterase